MLRSSWPILVIFTLAALTRIFLWNPNGAYFFPDEFRYEILDNSERILFDLFQIWGRPGFGIFYLPALSVGGPLPALIQNLTIQILNIILIYLTASRLTNKKTAALVGIVAIFTLPMATYMRHLLPYDAGLFLILLGLYLQVVWQKSFILGLLFGLSFLVYPSHFYYFLPVPILLAFFADRSKVHPTISSLKFCIGAIIPIIGAEFVSIGIGAPSYIASLKDLSGTVTQGDFILSAIFIKDYILAHSGAPGVIIFLVGAASLALASKDKKYKVITIYLISIFIILELFSHILETTVLYGRTIRPFYLLTLFAGSAAFFETFDNKLLRSKSSTLKLRPVGLRSIPKTEKFDSRIYPRNKLREITAQIKRMKNIPFVSVLFLVVLIATSLPGFINFKDIVYQADFTKLVQERNLLENPKNQIINPPLLYPYYGNAQPSCEKEILFASPDPLYSFKPYRYEGYDIAMREFLENDPPKHEVFFCK